MDVILSTVHWQFALVYLAAIEIFSKSPEAYIKHVRHVLTLLHDTGDTNKLKNWEFFNTIYYLHHVINPRQLAVSLHTIDAVRKLEPPTKIMGLR